ncbi:MAG: hypothetical protein DIZ80_03160 [endosymbiont of Galathealinum brachiosum]|uniref:Uncharacterized protein n=1 Tax=endosymbiont of Galathealinum brachiosum TaxID=2200906 RepID=A0A370DHV6_9GAMM|nr:MAG: hypothetical protein DIZ80_03160 [endosymbiont of Galathealinum brachiosum]
MSNLSSNEKSLIFRGPPGRLLLHSSLPSVYGIDFKPDKKLSSVIGNTKSVFKFRSDNSGELKKLKVRLSPNIEPGLYHALLETQEGPITVDIDVEPRKRLTMSPVQMSLNGSPGDKVKIYVLFSNKGNVPLSIIKSDSIGIYDDDGIETAFASTYRMESKDLAEIFSNFSEKLRDGHGGLLKLRVLEGSGELKPGACRSVLIEVQLPSKLKPGHSYHGVWSLNSSEYAVTVTANK